MDFSQNEEDRRHHQTGPMKAFNPSVLVTATTAGSSATTTPSLAAAAATVPNTAKVASDMTAAVTGVAVTRRIEEHHQQSPLKAFEPTHAAGTSASHQNSKNNSPHTASLKLSFAGIDGANVPPVGSSSSANNGLLAGTAADGSRSSNSGFVLDTADVSNHSKQLKPLQVSRSPRSSRAEE